MADLFGPPPLDQWSNLANEKEREAEIAEACALVYERAAIKEFQGGIPKDEAYRQALKETWDLWLNH